MYIRLVVPSNYLILCRPLLRLPSIFPASRSFPMSQFFASGGLSIGVSGSALVLPMNIQDWFPLGRTGWISLQSKRLSRVFSNTTVQAHQILQCSALFILQLSHPYMTTEKTIVLTRRTFVGKVMSLLFNMLSSLATTFLSTSKHLLISWLQSPPAVIFRSVAQSCPTLCDPMNRSMPGLRVHHQLPEFTETHVHRVSDAIQPSHPLSSPTPPAPNPSQHQSLFQWVNSSHEVAKVLEFQL